MIFKVSGIVVKLVHVHVISSPCLQSRVGLRPLPLYNVWQLYTDRQEQIALGNSEKPMLFSAFRSNEMEFA